MSAARFHEITFDVRGGEILGFAGSEGNGQREAMRSLGGFEEASGQVVCAGRPMAAFTPRAALEAGVLSLSADRSAESIFATLGVRENMTVQVLGAFASGGLISAAKEERAAVSLVEKLNIVASDLDQAIGGLSGGNQQKTVLSRSFLYDAKALLIDEPTQGVDAKARFDIYRAIRAKADQGLACVINSSDAMELAGLCDRVLVFSAGGLFATCRLRNHRGEHRLVFPPLQGACGRRQGFARNGRARLVFGGQLAANVRRRQPAMVDAVTVPVASDRRGRDLCDRAHRRVPYTAQHPAYPACHRASGACHHRAFNVLMVRASMFRSARSSA